MLVAVLAAAVGCGDSESDEDLIREVIRLSFTTEDPQGDCRERLSDRLIARTYQTRERCETVQAGSEEDPAEKIDFRRVAVDADRATAEIEVKGGNADGVSGQIELVNEDGDWRIDDIGVPLLRTLVEAGIRATDPGNLPPGGLDCLNEELQALPDDEFRAAAYQLIGETPDSQRRTFELLAACDGPSGRSLLREAFEKGIENGLREDGASQQRIDCVLAGIRKEATDQDLIELLSRQDSRAAALQAFQPVIEACG